MPLSRRSLVGAGVGLAAAGLLKPFASRAAEPRFATDPFTLGVASGFPEPNAVVLWTRLAPEPFAPGGGMPSAPVEVRWEIAGDEGFKQIERKGTGCLENVDGILGANSPLTFGRPPRGLDRHRQ